VAARGGGSARGAAAIHGLLRRALPAIALLLLASCRPAVPLNASSLVPVAVLGDSDSHGYQDRLHFPPDSGRRGGQYHAVTLQWTEVLATLRASHLDLGERAPFGSRYGTLARLQDALGIPTRVPEKDDHRYNYAISGVGCDSLNGGWSRQAPRLVTAMNRDPARWAAGIVVIRVGVNTFGQAEHLDRLAAGDPDGAVGRSIDACVAAVETAYRTLRATHPDTRIVLVGIFDNTHWARHLERWHDPTERARISSALDRFDDGLRRIVARDPRSAFFDDRAWFASLWGGRASDGTSAYREVKIADDLVVTNTAGDHPRNAVLADGHCGLAWNALWAASLVALMNERFGMRTPPIGSDEVATLLRAAWTAAPERASATGGAPR
jgi:hypothetical protein